MNNLFYFIYNTHSWLNYEIKINLIYGIQDDFEILMISVEEFQIITHDIIQENKQMGLTVNEEKRKYMIVSLYIVR